jgi:hypothetical protein
MLFIRDLPKEGTLDRRKEELSADKMEGGLSAFPTEAFNEAVSSRLV